MVRELVRYSNNNNYLQIKRDTTKKIISNNNIKREITQIISYNNNNLKQLHLNGHH